MLSFFVRLSLATEHCDPYDACRMCLLCERCGFCLSHCRCPPPEMRKQSGKNPEDKAVKKALKEIAEKSK